MLVTIDGAPISLISQKMNQIFSIETDWAENHLEYTLKQGEQKLLVFRTRLIWKNWDTFFANFKLQKLTLKFWEIDFFSRLKRIDFDNFSDSRLKNDGESDGAFGLKEVWELFRDTAPSKSDFQGYVKLSILIQKIIFLDPRMLQIF